MPCRGVVVDERHLDRISIVEAMEGADERGLAKLGILLHVHDTEHLGFCWIATLAEHANTLGSGAT